VFSDSWAFIFSPFGVAIVAIAGGILSGIVATLSKARLRELEIRERIAMIEHGLVPPPEKDPAEFEQRMQTIDRVQGRGVAGPRFRTGGIMVMSVGFGLMLLLWFVGVEREGIGVGGFIVIIGLGMLVNSLFNHPRSYQSPSAPPSSAGPSDTGPKSY